MPDNAVFIMSGDDCREVQEWGLRFWGLCFPETGKGKQVLICAVEQGQDQDASDNDGDYCKQLRIQGQFMSEISGQ